jgi:predicted Zn-dependent protease
MRKIIVFLVVLMLSTPATAGINLIRDAEIEHILKEYGDPIFKAAGLNPESIKIYIVNDNSINAFAAGGQNLFVHTGLILRTENANMLIGVMAHETGHIASGHIVKRESQAGNLGLEALLTTALGAAVTVAGLPDAGMAVLAGGQHLAERQYLQFSREQEVEADQRGLDYLQKTHQSSEGLLDVMQILRRQQTLEFGQVDPYAISHPLSQERIAHIRSQANTEHDVKEDGFKDEHERMLAKLYGFLEKPESTYMKYTDDSVPALYARAIAYNKDHNAEKSFAELDKLLAISPNDPFFNELKGQFLSEAGKIDEALGYYIKADKNFPDSALIKFEIGKIYNNNNDNNNALRYLSQTTQLEPTNDEAWRMIAGVYGKLGNKGMLNLALAEESNLQNNNDQARNYARIAKKNLEKNTPGWIRANDILSDIKIKKDNE